MAFAAFALELRVRADVVGWRWSSWKGLHLAEGAHARDSAQHGCNGRLYRQDGIETAS